LEDVRNLRSVLMSELEAALSQQVGISTIGGCGEGTSGVFSSVVEP
jgi:hypothetical protein